MELFRTVFSLSPPNNQLDAKSFAFHWKWKGIYIVQVRIQNFPGGDGGANLWVCDKTLLFCKLLLQTAFKWKKLD